MVAYCASTIIKHNIDVVRNLNLVLISHPHQDHYGLASFARPELPVLIGDAARRILRVATQFTPSGLAPNVFTPLRDRELLSVGPFRITPYLVDHSAYDAYAILVDCNDRRLLYSGDFRGHGRKAKVFERYHTEQGVLHFALELRPE